MKAASLLETVKTFLEKEGIRFHQTDGQPQLHFGFAGRNGRFLSHMAVNEKARRVVVITDCPLSVPPEQRTAVTELVARINNDLALGNFDLDMDDGEIQYRTGFMLEGDDVDPGLLRHTVFANWVTTDMYFPAFAAVLYQGMPPKEALEGVKDALLKHSKEEAKRSPSPRFGGRLGELLGDSGN
ncbi:MAG: YbjN domain-containing protein [Phycisphaerae bacterium]